MQPPHHLVLTLLCSLPLLSAVLSIQCNKSQYAWPGKNPQFCCKSCPPGEHMAWRSDTVCDIRCEKCLAEQYSNISNVELNCKFCRNCDDELNMEYESQCNSTHNAVCRCKAGYSCQNETCASCVPRTTTTTSSTLSPTTTPTPTTTTTTKPPTPDTPTGTVWFLLIVALLCALVALIVVAKVHSLQRWIRYKLGYFLAEKPTPVTPSEEDDVPKPIQEVCGKCDQLLDV